MFHGTTHKFMNQPHILLETPIVLVLFKPLWAHEGLGLQHYCALPGFHSFVALDSLLIQLNTGGSHPHSWPLEWLREG